MKCVKLLCDMDGYPKGAIVRLSEDKAKLFVTNDYAWWASREDWKLGGRLYLKG